MAIFHCEVKNHTRQRSIFGAIAYRTGEVLTEPETGRTYDYSKKQGVVLSKIILCDGAPSDWKDRKVLWRAVEVEETRKDARLAREFEISLPRELSEDLQLALADEYAKYLASQGMCVDYSVHSPEKKGKNHNPHVHMMCTTRPVDKKTGVWLHKSRTDYALDADGNRIPILDANGKQKIGARGRKLWKRVTVQANPFNDKNNVAMWRKAWEQYANSALERAGLEERIDCRSLEEQGIERAALVHEGVDQRMRDRGVTAERNSREINEEVKRLNSNFENAKADFDKVKVEKAKQKEEQKKAIKRLKKEQERKEKIRQLERERQESLKREQEERRRAEERARLEQLKQEDEEVKPTEESSELTEKELELYKLYEHWQEELDRDEQERRRAEEEQAKKEQEEKRKAEEQAKKEREEKREPTFDDFYAKLPADETYYEDYKRYWMSERDDEVYKRAHSDVYTQAPEDTGERLPVERLKPQFYEVRKDYEDTFLDDLKKLKIKSATLISKVIEKTKSVFSKVSKLFSKDTEETIKKFDELEQITTKKIKEKQAENAYDTYIAKQEREKERKRVEEQRRLAEEKVRQEKLKKEREEKLRVQKLRHEVDRGEVVFVSVWATRPELKKRIKQRSYISFARKILFKGVQDVFLVSKSELQACADLIQDNDVHFFKTIGDVEGCRELSKSKVCEFAEVAEEFAEKYVCAVVCNDNAQAMHLAKQKAVDYHMCDMEHTEFYISSRELQSCERLIADESVEFYEFTPLGRGHQLSRKEVCKLAGVREVKVQAPKRSQGFHM